MRIWSPWLAPRHGKETFDLDKDAVMVAFLSPQGRHMVLLAISGLSDIVAVFRSGESGSLVLNVCFTLRAHFQVPSHCAVLMVLIDP